MPQKGTTPKLKIFKVDRLFDRQSVHPDESKFGFASETDLLLICQVGSFCLNFESFSIGSRSNQKPYTPLCLYRCVCPHCYHQCDH